MALKHIWLYKISPQTFIVMTLHYSEDMTKGIILCHLTLFMTRVIFSVSYLKTLRIDDLIWFHEENNTPGFGVLMSRAELFPRFRSKQYEDTLSQSLVDSSAAKEEIGHITEQLNWLYDTSDPALLSKKVYKIFGISFLN